jgi:hypothetical protein
MPGPSVRSDPLDLVPSTAGEFCHDVLGDVSVVADRSWPHRRSVVLQLRDARGVEWILKHFRHEENFRREVDAYRHWVSSLGGAAPSLLAVSDDSRSILLTAEPGEVRLVRDADVHHRAGSLVRRFHAAVPAKRDDGLADRLADRLERFSRTAGHLITEEDRAFLREGIDMVQDLAEYDLVPVHLDNQPRNWLVDAGGAVRLIDFELSRLDVWVRDLVRLQHWDWEQDSELREAFCDGYGARLTEDDLLLMDVMGALSAATTVLWAREHGDRDFEQRGRSTLALIRKRRW